MTTPELEAAAKAMFADLNPGIRMMDADLPYYCQAFAAGLHSLRQLATKEGHDQAANFLLHICGDDDAG
jgi:hypothetical protein